MAVIWVGENDTERVFTYGQLYRQVNRCANALKKLGLKKGDRVTIYLPKVPEQIVAMLACARIGAIHSVVYSGFSAPALANRIHDAESHLVITADVGYDRGKVIPLKSVVDEALKTCPTVEHVIVVRRQKPEVSLAAPKEIDWHEWIKGESPECEAAKLDAEDPLYILYTSGTTGKPKGVVHVYGGYMVGTYITSKYVFDLKDDDVYFCVADPGWVTGHSYIVYGPLLNGATILTAEGKPDYPNPGRRWDLIEPYGGSIFYTTPAPIRLFRWFVGLNMDDPIWNVTVFSKNRDRLLEGGIAKLFLEEVVAQARELKLTSDEHFSVDGTLLEAWASMKSFRPKGENGGDNNGWGDFRGTTRTNEMHESKTDPESKLMRKGAGREAKLSFMGHALVENRNGLLVDLRVSEANGCAERDTAIEMLGEHVAGRATVGADRGYDTRDFVARCREHGVTPHVAKNEHARRSSAIDADPARRPGDAPVTHLSPDTRFRQSSTGLKK